MSEEKKNNVTQKTAMPLEMLCERRRWKIKDEKTGEEREIDSVQISAELDGESFRFKLVDRDAKLFQYIMKKMGYPLLDVDGSIVEVK